MAGLVKKLPSCVPRKGEHRVEAGESRHNMPTVMLFLTLSK